MSIHNISSSSESGSNSYDVSLTDELDEDYAIMDGASQDDEGYSYSTEIPDEEEEEDDDDVHSNSNHNGVDGNLLGLKQKLDEGFSSFLAKSPEFPPLPEKKNPSSGQIKGSSSVVKGSGFWRKIWFFSNLMIRAAMIFVLFSQLHGLIDTSNHYKALVSPKISVESVSVFPINHDSVSGNITANWNMIFNVRNPSENHILSYDDTTAEVLFGNTNNFKNPVLNLNYYYPALNQFIQPLIPCAKSTIWKTDLNGFHQAGNERNLVKVTFSPFPVSIDNATAAALVKDIKSGASGAFSVRLNGTITQLHPEKVNIPASFTADCPLNMAFIDTGGVMASPSEECKVYRGELLNLKMFAVYSGAILLVILNTQSYVRRKVLSGIFRSGKSAVSHAKVL
ncbi:OLC1v1020352C1 [Oldenlandia corymbosa var. corymbosa]|uniref:OLC1v1020352C1 n=1 Tax=Oldenlandia corymbosa var. corymbosa TaxID=529605 RepID=A0AAV1EGR8_OLDCO|nr:OLC1v1020352C1 [Oldenlandia corymbosa var. corymbosa]